MSYPVDRQTDRQTDECKNVTSLSNLITPVSITNRPRNSAYTYAHVASGKKTSRFISSASLRPSSWVPSLLSCQFIHHFYHTHSSYAIFFTSYCRTSDHLSPSTYNKTLFFFGFYMLSDFSVCFFGFSLSLVSIHTRDTDMGFLSVRPSIAVLSLNHYMYCRTFYTVWYCHDSSFFFDPKLCGR